ncbi:MAG: hypothetical protein JXJ17_05200 [Anaerolineae bacterium]|nr:hypothetical protein [Anaerolineae bacterium]
MSIEFYDVKIREKVKIDKGKITKIKITQKNGQVRYAFRAMTDDGRKLTKFCSKADWDAMDVPQG